MNSYEVFENEEQYVIVREEAMRCSRDRAMRRTAIRIFKEIYGSCLRKLFEVTGWHNGEFLESDIVWKRFGNYNYHKETYKFLECLIEAFNDNAEYRRRKTPMKNWKSRVCKKHFNAYLLRGEKELRSYRVLFAEASSHEQFQAMRMALIMYNTILRAFFVRRPPKRIPMKLYHVCIKLDSGFGKYYKEGPEKAQLTLLGKQSRANRYGGLKNTFNDEIIWQFILYFLRKNR